MFISDVLFALFKETRYNIVIIQNQNEETES